MTLNVLEGHKDVVICIAWSLDGLLLASSCDDRTIRIWNPFSGKTLHVLPGGLASDLTWSPDGAILASGSEDGIITWWDTRTWKAEKSLAAHAGAVSAVAWSKDGRILASSSTDKTVKLWDRKTGEQLFSTIRGHSGRVFDLAWTNDAKRIVTASEDTTVRIWDIETGRAQTVLEGHTNWVTCARVSPDGEVIASKSDDDTIRLWATETGECLAILQEPKSRHWLTGLSFHPYEPVLATLGEKDQVIRLWELDYPSLFANSEVSTQYANAKVVIVGDQGVGKSALAQVLSGRPFQSTESTHGRHVRTLASDRTLLQRGVEVFREVILWDLPGESNSTLIQHTHLDEVAVALVVFDASRGGESLAAIAQWVRALRQTRLDHGGSAEGLKMFLVATRADIRPMTESVRQRVQRYMTEFGFELFFETSAAMGQNIAALRSSIMEAIDWKALPTVTSSALFQRIKNFLMAEKEANRLLSRQEHLYRAFLSHETELTGNTDLFREFETCIKLVESRGLIKVLSFGQYVLLQPELLDSYASAILNAASYDQSGTGMFYQEDLDSPRYKPRYLKLPDPAQEKILLTSALENFLRQELAYQDAGSAHPRFIFPSHAVLDLSDSSDEPAHELSFSFEGVVLTIYSTLAVRLANSGVFQIREVWKKGISYSVTRPGLYSLLLRERGEGAGELIVFFSSTADKDLRLQFQEYVHTHLLRHSLPGSVKRKRSFVCTVCGTPLSQLQVERRLKRGIDWIACGVCENHVSLVDDQLPSAGTSAAVVEIDHAANLQRNRQVAAMVLHGKLLIRDYDVFLCHTEEDRPFVRLVATKLKENGILPWFDEDELELGVPWQEVLESDLPRINTLLMFVGEHMPGSWRQLELNSIIHDFYARNGRLIPVRLPTAKTVSALPVYLRDADWIDFQKRNPDPMQQLIATITDERPLHQRRAADTSIGRLKSDLDDAVNQLADKGREIELALKRSDWATAHQLMIEVGHLLLTLNRRKEASVFTLQALKTADDPLRLDGKGLSDSLKLLIDTAKPREIEKWVRQCKHRTSALSELRLLAADGRDFLWKVIRNCTIEPWVKWFQTIHPNSNQISALPREGHSWPAIRLTRLRVENIKAFHDLEFDFRDESDKGSVPRMCSAIVGDNATGKSTLLQCIALGCLGHSLANQTDIRAISLLRNGAKKGAIEMELELTVDSNASRHETMAVTVGLELDQMEEDFRALPDNKMTFSKVNCVEHWSALRRQIDFHWGLCCGYGAFRGLRERTDKTTTTVLKAEIDRVLSLFQSHPTLMDPITLEAILQADVSSFSIEQKTIPLSISDEILRMLQGIVPGMEIEDQQGKRTLVEKYSRVRTLASLSDGPNSMIGLLGHLIRHSLEILGWLRKCEDGFGTNNLSSPLKIVGIVLIDELDLHLHPSWQRLALAQLQDAFPNLQFIVTTHSPLVLGGIPDGKVTVLRRNEDGRVTALKDEPSVKGWRIDQLLTGVHFDVPSSYDTTTERLITRYARLLNEKGGDDPAVRQAAREIEAIKPPEHTGAEVEMKAWDLLTKLTQERIGQMSEAERERMLLSIQRSKGLE